MTTIKSQTTYLFSITHSSLAETHISADAKHLWLPEHRLNLHVFSEPSVFLELTLLPVHSGKPSPNLCSYDPTTWFMQYGNENSKMEKCNPLLFKGMSY